MSRATAAAVDVGEAYAAAVERRKARANHYRSYSDSDELKARLEGRTLERVSITAPEYREPSSPAEFWDERIIEAGGAAKRSWPELAFLAGLAAAARDGEAAARAAVRDARQLEPAQQWAAFQNLVRWKADAARFGAERTVNAVLTEWSRWDLAEEEPDGDD